MNNNMAVFRLSRVASLGLLSFGVGWAVLAEDTACYQWGSVCGVLSVLVTFPSLMWTSLLR